MIPQIQTPIFSVSKRLMSLDPSSIKEITDRVMDILRLYDKIEESKVIEILKSNWYILISTITNLFY